MEGIEHKTVNVNGINIHIAEKGEGPLILFIHGFPNLWYSWRNQITYLASLGYHCVVPDLRGFGDTDVPVTATSYTTLHVVGDLIGLLDTIAADEEKVLVVGHDWGAVIAWSLCLYRPDRVKALVNLRVAFTPRNPKTKPLDILRAVYGNDYYICRFQEFLTYSNPGPLCLPKGKAFGNSIDSSITLPSWLPEEEFNYYVTKYNKTGFTGALNYCRNLDLNLELAAPWTGAQIKVPVKFIVGDLDLTYTAPGSKDYIHSGGFKRFVPLLEDVVVIDGAGHFLHEERADEINQHIYAFFSKF
ncbi:unnamed protein product [Lupinus luteus]|uniref:AB hydrolase-1 domain-containing protein n=1 Tax=Lupinus luteus TaxID=3873 RepID=A0AAV1WBW1_LUPLU